MSNKAFDDFLARQAATPELHVNWDQKRDAWLAYLAAFYDQVKQYLKDYTASGKVMISNEPKEIFEEFIGKYTADVLCLDVAGHKVRLEPIGTNLIGAKGRVDMEGAHGKARFVLVDEDTLGPAVKFKIRIGGEEEDTPATPEPEARWVWKIATPPPRISYLELNEDSFLQALMDVVGD